MTHAARLAGAAVGSVQAAAATESPALAAVARLGHELEAVGLADLGAAVLLERVDRKFVMAAAGVPSLLGRCAAAYRALEVRGVRLARYHTVYFDTPDLALYHAHHAGRRPRHKVRVRTYVDGGACFLEVKRSTNTGRTLKSRVAVRSAGSALSDPVARALLQAEGLDAARLRETLVVAYRRFTLVGRDAAERVTLDLALELSAGGRRMGFPALAIVEVKQSRRAATPLTAALRELGARPQSVSKYCLGVASLVDGARINHFKPVLRHVHRATHWNVHRPCTR